MKISAKSLAIAFGLLMLSVGCLGQTKANARTNTFKPVFDQEIGRLEEGIIQEFGEPDERRLMSASELGGELRSVLKTKVESKNTLIKELYYEIDSHVRIFWLTNQSVGEWRVISDVEIPAGTVF